MSTFKTIAFYRRKSTQNFPDLESAQAFVRHKAANHKGVHFLEVWEIKGTKSKRRVKIYDNSAAELVLKDPLPEKVKKKPNYIEGV